MPLNANAESYAQPRPAGDLAAAALRIMGRAAALAGLGLFLAAAAPERDGAAGVSIVAALGAGASDISTAAEQLDGSPLTWASWTEGTPDRWVTRLVLINRGAAGVAITWGVQRLDAYGAVLRPTLWQRNGRPVLILQYQFGAAVTRMELFVATPDGQAHLLGQVDGALIGLERHGGRDTLRAYDTGFVQGKQRCYGWDGAAATLVAIRCPADRPGMPP